MKKIKLTQEYYAIVDNEDYEYLNKWKWHTRKIKHAVYAKRSFKGTTIYLHKELLNCPKNMMIDHINRNGLDNRKSNLRIVTRSQNLMNSKKPKGKLTSKYKGVYKDTSRKKWVSEIRLNGKSIYLGRFNSQKEAAKQYNKAAIKYFKKYARLNIL